MDVNDDNLPELTEEEQAALDAFPPCSVRHWIQGEKLNFELNRWEGAGLLGVKEPDHYRFLRGSGSGGVTTEEVFLCDLCKLEVKRVRKKGFGGTHARAWDGRQFKDSWGKGDFSGLRQRWTHQNDRE